MGSTTVQAPAPRNPAAESSDMLAAQLAAAPQQFANYAEFAPLYDQVDLSRLSNLLGAPQDASVFDLNRRLTDEAMMQSITSNRLQREADLLDATQLGGVANEVARTNNAELYSSLNRLDQLAGANAGPGGYEQAAGQMAMRGAPAFQSQALGFNAVGAPMVSGPGGVDSVGAMAIGGVGGPSSVNAGSINAPWLASNVSAPGGFRNVNAGMVGGPAPVSNVNAAMVGGVPSVNSQMVNGPAGFERVGNFGVSAPGGVRSVGANPVAAPGGVERVGNFNVNAPGGFRSVGANAVNAPGAVQNVMAQGPDSFAMAAGQQAARGPGDIQRTLEGQAMGDLAMGGGLTAQETRSVLNPVVNRFAAAGLGRSNAAVAEATLALDGAQRQRLNERRAFAAGVDAQGFGQRQAAGQLGLAASGAMQNYAAQDLAAQQANQQAGITQNQMGLQAGMANQDAFLRAALANQQADITGGQLGLQAQLANQDQATRAAMANQQAGLAQNQLGAQVGLANQDAMVRAQMANQQADISGNQLGLQAQLANQDQATRAALANQQAGLTQNQLGLQAGLANQDAALRAGLANQQVGMQGQLANQDAVMRAQLANQQAGLAQNQLGMQGQLANQDAFLRSELANQQASITAGQMGLQAQLANQANAQQASAFGLQQQQLNQDAGLRAQLANQQAGLTYGQMNLQGQQANQDAFLRAALANQQAQLQGNQFGLQAGLANQQAMMQAQLANQDAGMRMGLANEANRFAASQYNADLANRQFSQLMGLGAAQDARNQAAFGQYATAAQGRMSTYQDPFLAILGRQSANVGTNAGLAGMGQGIVGSNNAVRGMFDPFNAYASDLFNTNYNADFNARVATANNRAALIGSLIGAAGTAAGGYPGRPPCWVARAVYGEHDVRWTMFREWLLVAAPAWFRNLYIKHGERFAAWVANKPRIKGLIRRWMDARIESYYGA